MISTQDLYKEIEKYDDLIGDGKIKDPKKVVSDDDFKKAVIKLATLELKLLHNIRTNTVKVMEKFNIAKVKPKKTDESKPSE